jgi:hypothetical protein
VRPSAPPPPAPHQLSLTWYRPRSNEARAELLRSPYFRAWHPSIFSLFLTHGLVNLDPSPSIPTEAADGVPVTLACPRWAEAAVFTDWKGIQAGYDKLPFLSEKVKVRFVMAGDNSACVQLSCLGVECWCEG